MDKQTSRVLAIIPYPSTSRSTTRPPRPSCLFFPYRTTPQALLFVIKDHPREVSIVTSEDAQSALYALLTTRYGIAQPGAATSAPPPSSNTASAATSTPAAAAGGTASTAGATGAASSQGAPVVSATVPAAAAPAAVNGVAAANGSVGAQVILVDSRVVLRVFVLWFVRRFEGWCRWLMTSVGMHSACVVPLCLVPFSPNAPRTLVTSVLA